MLTFALWLTFSAIAIGVILLLLAGDDARLRNDLRRAHRRRRTEIAMELVGQLRAAPAAPPEPAADARARGEEAAGTGDPLRLRDQIEAHAGSDPEPYARAIHQLLARQATSEGRPARGSGAAGA